MLTREEAVAACLRLRDTFEDYPFDDFNWTCMRRRSNKRIFAAIYERQGRIWINLKTEPIRGELLRMAYAAVVPGYHMNKRHWISVILDGSMTDEDIFPLIEESHRLTAPHEKKAKA